MADDFAGTTATLGAVAIGGTTTGNIEQAGDHDWFKVSLTANTTYLFRLEASNAGAGSLGTGSAMPYLGLYSSSGGFLKSSFIGSDFVEPVLLYTPTASGDYFLDVEELYGTGTGTYRLRAELGLPDDFGENTSTTGLLNAGGTATGNIEQAADRDWFKIYLSAGKTYALNLEGSDSGGGTLGAGAHKPYLGLYSSTGSYIVSTFDGSAAGEPSLHFTPQASGYYFVEASELALNGTGTYRFRATLESPEDYAGDTSTTGVLAIGGQITGTIEQLQDRDWFKVHLKGGSQYLINLDGADSGGGTLGAGVPKPSVTLYSNAGAVLLSSSSGSSVGEPQMNIYITLTGDYYLGVGELNGIGTGSYTLRAKELDIGPTANTVSNVIYSGDLRADSLIAEATDWNYLLPARTTLYYTFDTSLISSATSKPVTAFNAAQKAAAIEILNHAASVTGISFAETPSAASADIHFGGSDVASPNAVADSLSNEDWTLAANGALATYTGESFVYLDNAEWASLTSQPVKGSQSYEALLHQIGHVLGLGHPNSGYFRLPTNEDNTGNTVMSTTHVGDYKSSFQPYDLLALQWIYGGDGLRGNQGLNSVNGPGFTPTIPVTPTAPSYTVSGTLANDVLVPAAGNSYRGGAGNDTYIISPSTLTAAVTASVVDTEGANVIQLVDGLSLSASSFYADAAQLTLASGAVLQILGASKFSFQVGANAVAGDAAAFKSYAEFALALGGSLPTGSSPVSGTPNFQVPAAFDAAAAPVAQPAAASVAVAGTLGPDIAVITAGNSYLGGKGDDLYIVGGHTLAGPVTATLSDTEGSNTLQLVDGTVISSSSFLNDAVQLTLSTGAKVQVLGASKFSFQVGANAPGGDSASSLSYAQFGSALGASIPAVGGAAVSGTANFVVPTASGSGSGQGAGSSLAPHSTWEVQWPALSGAIDADADRGFIDPQGWLP